MVDDTVDFLHAVELSDVVIHEERGRRVYWSEEDAADHEFPLTKNSLATTNDGSDFRFRFRMVFVDERAEYVTDVEVVYSSENRVELAPHVVPDFASRVAFMAAYPFMRASIFATASRLGMPAPILALVRQGEFSLGESLAPEDLESQFFNAKSELA